MKGGSIGRKERRCMETRKTSKRGTDTGWKNRHRRWKEKRVRWTDRQIDTLTAHVKLQKLC